MPAAEHNPNEFFLTPEVQDAFWASLDPDIRAMLVDLESKESWTYKFDELPKLFTETANALPKVVETPPSTRDRDLLRKIISVLASMPIRQAVSAIAYLDRSSSNSSAMGWSILCYMEASHIRNEEKESPIFLHAKIVSERIEVLLRTKLAIDLFCNLTVKTER